MHDVDRTQLEYGSEFSEYGEIPEYSSGSFEYGESGTVLEAITGDAGEGSWETSYEYGESSMDEIMEDELASELLGVSNDQELDHFLGSLISKAAKGIGKFVSSPAGKALGGILKQVAKKALPIAGGALGTFIGGPAGAALGGKLASMAGDAFGLEAEGLSPEDHDFEVAKRYVRLAHHAARKVATAPPTVNPHAIAKAAVVEAAKKYAPGLLAPVTAMGGAAGHHAPYVGGGYSGTYPPAPGAPIRTARPVTAGGYPPADYGAAYGQHQCPNCGSGQMHHRRQGRWVRRGRHIVLLGV